MKIKYLLPFFILFLLLAILARELFYAKPHEIPSALIGEEVPQFQLQDIMHKGKLFTRNDLLGHVSLLNIWATWCSACTEEETMLMQIKQQYHIPIYGIIYKDKPDDINKWLHNGNNPFVMLGDDAKGDVGIDLGIYGTPETFVINRAGKIVYRHVGAIDQQTWNDVLYPLIKKLEKETT